MEGNCSKYYPELLVHTDNDAQEEKSENEEEETPHTKLRKSTTEFLAIIDQQKAFMKRNNLPVKFCQTTGNTGCWKSDCFAQQAAGSDQLL